MKKLMLVAAIVCAAAMSQAASVAWGNSASTSPLVGLDGTTKITKANATAWSLAVMLVDADGTIVQTANNPNKSAGAISGTNWTYTFGSEEGQYTTGDLFSIIATMTVDGKNYEMTIADNLAITAINNSGTDTFTWAAGNYGGLADTPTTGKWSAVPEPTSGLLLLLGIGAMALKRKRA